MKKFTRINLNYDLDALEPFISKETMDLHYNKHHAGYEAKLNEALEDVEPLDGVETLKDLMINYPKFKDEGLRVKTRRFGGGLINHNHFFSTLKKDSPLTEDLEIHSALLKQFETIDAFKEIFVRHALRLFGSGWVWLTLNNAKGFKILQTSNQDNPWMIRQVVTPLVGIDVWEHAYYVDYKNRRAEYIENFFNVIDWKKVNEIYLQGLSDIDTGVYKINSRPKQQHQRRRRNNNNNSSRPRITFQNVKNESNTKARPNHQESNSSNSGLENKKEVSLNKENVVEVKPEWKTKVFKG